MSSSSSGTNDEEHEEFYEPLTDAGQGLEQT